MQSIFILNILFHYAFCYFLHLLHFRMAYKMACVLEKIRNYSKMFFIWIIVILKNGHIGIHQFYFFTYNQTLNMQFRLSFQKYPDLRLVIKRPVITAIIQINFHLQII